MENEPLVADLVTWIAEKPRQYDEVMDAWRTSCPRLTIWEDVIDAGLVCVDFKADTGKIVAVTERGLSWLQAHGARH